MGIVVKPTPVAQEVNIEIKESFYLVLKKMKDNGSFSELEIVVILRAAYPMIGLKQAVYYVKDEL